MSPPATRQRARLPKIDLRGLFEVRWTLDWTDGNWAQELRLWSNTAVVETVDPPGDAPGLGGPPILPADPTADFGLVV